MKAILKLEVIRQAAIPYHDNVQNREYTPLPCIERVWQVELLAETPENHRLPVRLDLDVAGVGRQQYEIPIYIPDESELVLLRAHGADASRVSAQHVTARPAQAALKRPT